MPIRTQFSQITVPAGNQTTPKNNQIILPATGGSLVGVTIWLSAVSVGPVNARADIGIGGDTYVQLANAGWIRSDANLNGSDAWTWTGRVPLPTYGTTPLVWPFVRNDTGASVSVTVGIYMEVP